MTGRQRRLVVVSAFVTMSDTERAARVAVALPEPARQAVFDSGNIERHLLAAANFTPSNILQHGFQVPAEQLSLNLNITTK